MENENNEYRPCRGRRRCGWGILAEEESSDTILCIDGGGGYKRAQMLKAKNSVFHTPAIKAATDKIEAALNDVIATGEGNGRRLSFLFTDIGVVLAWVDHDATIPKGRDIITEDSSDAEVIKALGLKIEENTQST